MFPRNTWSFFKLGHTRDAGGAKGREGERLVLEHQVQSMAFYTSEPTGGEGGYGDEHGTL